MIEPTSTPTNNSESRLELTLAAAEAERANRPRWIIVLGVVLLAVAIIYTLTQASARATMFGKIEGERSATRKVQDLRNAIDTETTNLARRGTAPDARVGQKIEDFARFAQITLAGAVTDQTRTGGGVPGMQQHVYTARAMNQEPDAVLSWLNSIRTSYESSGLEITRLRLAPGAATAGGTAGWNVDLELARWERKPQ
jgi:type II secretory pathway component PulM